MQSKINMYFMVSISLIMNSAWSKDDYKITILTQPVGHHFSGYTGHYGVTRSLVEGFKKTGILFNYNPLRIEDVGDVVCVLSDINALRQAITLRKQGKVKKILAGPNLMVRSNESNHILASKEIDVCLVPSDWVKNAYIEDEPSLRNRIAVWYAGIDTHYWNPVSSPNHNKTNNVLVYWKTESESFCINVENVLRSHRYNPIRIKYGSYNQGEYKRLLSSVDFALFISRSESQGLAIAEAWAMNVPTLIWDAQESFVINHKIYWPILAAPYLNDSVGMIWNDLNCLDAILENFQLNINKFTPRDWVLRNMSDEISAQLLLKIIKSPVNDFLALKLD